MTAAVLSNSVEDFTAWYDAKSDEMQELIDEISTQTSYIIDEDEFDSFIEELDSYGITTSTQFEDAFRGEWEGYGERVTTEFSEEYCDEWLTCEVPELIKYAIDYQLVWYQSLQHEFFTIEFKDNTYFFHNSF